MFNFLYNSKPLKILLFILFIIFLQRGATLFVEFYDVDEITEVLMVNELVEGGKAFIDSAPTRPIYTLYFYIILKLFGAGNYFALHFITIIWIAFTAFVLYLINKEILNEKAGYIAAISYGIFISGFFEFNLALHGEIIFNLFVCLAFYYFVLYLKNKASLKSLFLTGFFAFLSFLTKGQTLVFIGMYGFLILLVTFIYQKESKKLLSIIKSELTYLFGIVFAFLIFYLITSYYGYFENFIANYIGGNVKYIKVGMNKVDYLAIIKKGLIQYFIVIVSHLPLWIALFYFLLKKDLLKQQNYLILAAFFLFANFGIILGGKRFYFHYFLQLMPSLVLITGIIVLYLKKQFTEKSFLYKSITILITTAIFFYSILSYSIAYFKNTNPDAIYNENYTLINNHAVVARREYKKVAQWIRKNSKKDDRILQWGDCIELYHFSDRRLGIRFPWISGFTDRFFMLQESNDKQFNEKEYMVLKSEVFQKKWLLDTRTNIQYSLICDIERKKPKFIIDTAESSFRGFSYPIDSFPILYDYISENYSYIKSISKMKIYEINH